MATRFDPSTLRKGREAPQPPPRLVGAPEQDILAIQEWVKQFFDSLMGSGLGDPVYQYAPVEIDKDAPPDPAMTTIARAQATANLALTLIAAQAGIIQWQTEQIESLKSRVTALETPPGP